MVVNLTRFGLAKDKMCDIMGAGGREHAAIAQLVERIHGKE